MKFYLVLFVLFVVTFFYVRSQEEEGPTPLGPGRGSAAIYLGPVGGFNRAIHSAKIASFADDPLCPYFTNGSSNGFFIGGFYEQVIGGIASKHSIVARILYSTLPSSFSQENDALPSLVEDGKGGYTTVISTTKHFIDVKYSLLSIEAMYKFNVTSGIVLTAGPTFDIALQKKLTQTFKLIEPNYVRFKRVDTTVGGLQPVRYEDNDRTIVVFDGDVARPSKSNNDVKANPIRFAFKMGLQYEIITGTKIDIIPGIFYTIGLTNINSVETWKVSALQVGVDVRFTL
ncbi:MAG: hypothetical protein ACUVQ1_04135 [Candidatus Kapaibacteriales bacterium]